MHSLFRRVLRRRAVDGQRPQPASLSFPDPVQASEFPHSRDWDLSTQNYAVDNGLTRFVIGGTLPELWELFLSENRIATDRFLTFLPRLKYLSLKGNALTQVDFYHQRESLEGVNLLQMPLGRVQLPRSVGLTLPSVLELAAMGIPVVRPVVIQSIEFRPTEASVSIGILADRGEYDVLMSADLAVWTPIGEIGVVDQYVTTVGKFTVDSSVPARFFQVRYGD